MVCCWLMCKGWWAWGGSGSSMFLQWTKTKGKKNVRGKKEHRPYRIGYLSRVPNQIDVEPVELWGIR